VGGAGRGRDLVGRRQGAGAQCCGPCLGAKLTRRPGGARAPCPRCLGRQTASPAWRMPSLRARRLRRLDPRRPAPPRAAAAAGFGQGLRTARRARRSRPRRRRTRRWRCTRRSRPRWPLPRAATCSWRRSRPGPRLRRRAPKGHAGWRGKRRHRPWSASRVELRLSRFARMSSRRRTARAAATAGVRLRQAVQQE
jgi:hypothetical protein